MQKEEEFLKEIGDLLRKQRADAENEKWLEVALKVVCLLGLITVGIGLSMVF